MNCFAFTSVYIPPVLINCMAVSKILPIANARDLEITLIDVS